MEEKDRQAVLEMVMDISGARAAIRIALDILNKTNVSNLDGVIFEVCTSSTEVSTRSILEIDLYR